MTLENKKIEHLKSQIVYLTDEIQNLNLKLKYALFDAEALQIENDVLQKMLKKGDQ